MTMTPASFAQDLADGLGELRAYTEARMTSRGTVMRKTGDNTVVDGFEVPEWEAVHVDEPLRFVGGSSRRIEIGGIAFDEATGRADFRHNLTDLEDGDLIDLTAGEWAGSVLRVVEAIKGDQRTARRVPVVEVDRPGEWT